MMRKGNNARRPASSGTPAVAAAKGAAIPFSVHEYTHDPAAASYGLEAATKLGLDPVRVFKTLVASVDGSPPMALVPVTGSLDLKALAAAAGGKRASMAEPRAAERATGYVAGGISPLGQRRKLPAVVDRSALNQDTVFVSAGRRGLEIQLEPADLVRLLDARIAPIGR
jgi:Cys-tRNA(Pro)/Cys-tRNA(Cys) deacylase